MFLLYYINSDDEIVYWKGYAPDPMGDWTLHREHAARISNTTRAKKIVKRLNETERQFGNRETFYRLENTLVKNADIHGHIEKLKCI